MFVGWLTPLSAENIFYWNAGDEKRMPSHFGQTFWLAGFNSLALCDFLPAAGGAEKGGEGL